MKRTAGNALQRARERLRTRQPLCVRCLAKGRVRAWTQRDHIVALDNGGADTEDNVQGLCDECHRIKTNKDIGYRERVTIGLDGYPVDP